MSALIFTTLIQVLIGLLAPAILALWLGRRWGVPAWLLTVGALAGLLAAIFGAFLRTLLSGASVSLLPALPDPSLVTPVFAGGVGLLTGFLTAGLLTLGFVYLARGTRTFRQVVMVGVGFGGAEVVLRASLAMLLLLANLRLLDTPPDEWRLPPDELASRQADLDAYFARSPGEPLLDSVIGLMTIALGVAVTVLVGRMFLTGEVGYFFLAVLLSGLTTSALLLFSTGGPSTVTVVWLIVGALSWGVVRRQSRRSSG